MKKQVVLSGIAIVLCTAGFAQHPKDSILRPAEEHMTLLKEPALKNELGLNLIPFAAMLNDTRGGNIPLAHLFYKRGLTEHLYGRVSLCLNDGLKDVAFPEVSSGIRVVNMDVFLNRQEYKAPNYLQYFAGLERRWGKRNVSQFAGMDLSYAHYRATEEMTSTRLSGIGNYNDSTVWRRNYTNNAVGLHPFYGVNLNFSRHFFICTQVGFNLLFTSRNSQNVIDNSRFPLPAHTSIFNFDLNTFGVSNQISLGFRF